MKTPCFLLSAILLVTAGCKHALSPLPSGGTITGEFMVTSKLLPRDDKNDYSDLAAAKLLQEKFDLYAAEIAPGGSNDVVEYTLTSMKLSPKRNLVHSFVGLQHFAAAAEGSWAYPAIAEVSASGKYEQVLEVELKANDPQYELNYQVDPTELLEYQLRAEGRYKPVVLFQRSVCAPDKVIEYTFAEARVKSSLVKLLETSAMGSLSQRTDLSKTFVFRRYHSPEFVEALLRQPINMFEISTSVTSPSNGKRNVSPEQLTFTYKNKVYRLSDPYRRHLQSEGVKFDCTNLAPKPAPQKRKVTKR